MSIDMRELLADIIIKIIMGVVVIYILPAVNKLIESMRKNEELKGAMTIADTVVGSIQQQYSGKDGEERKARAIQRFIKLANEKGWKFTESEINQYLEKAVFDMKNYKKNAEVIVEACPDNAADPEVDISEDMPFHPM